MRVFITGASGYIGSAVVPELVKAGHRVIGLARSDASAATLAAAGAEVQRGTLDDLGSLRVGAAASDGVIHLAFKHDFSEYASAGHTDERAVETLTATLNGSDRPLVITSGTAVLPAGRMGVEHDVPDPENSTASLRIVGENAALSATSRGVRSSVVRLAPTVHDQGDQGFIPTLIGIARQKVVFGYVSVY